MSHKSLTVPILIHETKPNPQYSILSIPISIVLFWGVGWEGGVNNLLGTINTNGALMVVGDRK